jgi:hypothetical protein
MAFTQMKQGGRVPLRCGSVMGEALPVTFAAGSTNETVVPAASWNQFQWALTAATVVNAGDPVELFQQGDVGKGIAGASLGAGAPVGIGSTNGVLAPVPVNASAAYGARTTYAVGIALSNAAPGDIFSVYINPVQIV